MSPWDKPDVHAGLPRSEFGNLFRLELPSAQPLHRLLASMRLHGSAAAFIMMTDAQLEIAAREYCRLTSLHPDEEIAYASPAGPDRGNNHAVEFQPRWKVVAEKIRQFEILQHCVEFAESGTGVRDDVKPAPVSTGARMQRILSWFPDPRVPEIEAKIEE